MVYSVETFLSGGTSSRTLKFDFLALVEPISEREAFVHAQGELRHL
jgi:hypothetical protein